MADNTSNLINIEGLTTYHGLIKEYIDDKTAAGDGAVEEVNALIEDTWASGKRILADAITEKGAPVEYSATLTEMADAIDRMKVASGTATADQVLEGATFTNDSGSELTGTIPVVAGSTVTPGNSSKTIISGGSYVSSDVVVNGDGDLAAGNIKSGVNIFGVEGTCKPRK